MHKSKHITVFTGTYLEGDGERAFPTKRIISARSANLVKNNYHLSKQVNFISVLALFGKIYSHYIYTVLCVAFIYYALPQLTLKLRKH